MESPTHRANIVKPEYTRVGFGTANGLYEGRETTFVVEFFATPTVEKLAVADISPVKNPSPENISTSSAPVQVLGTQVETVSAAAAAPSWLDRLLTSPFHTLSTILTALFALIASLFTIAILMRGRAQHRSVVIGGALLIAFISGALLLSAVLTGPVLLSAVS